MERKTGAVVHLVKDRGYWFILFQGRRIFCHVSNWSQVEFPAIGDLVSFEFGPARQSNFQDQAVNVRPDVTAGVDALAKVSE